MLEPFLTSINANFPFLKGKRVGVAISGGLDSVTLASLFVGVDCSLSLVHCNFELREAESDQDEQFLKEFAGQHNLPLHIAHFNTKAYATTHKLSIQMAARELRYTWFEELIAKNTLDYIATAHHADDAVETMFINLSRGTGLKGLLGIPAVNKKIVRPLLKFSRNQIESYAKKHDIKWREDSSNASDAYLRNQIRHHLIPQCNKISADFSAQILATQVHLKESNKLLEAHLADLKEQLIIQDGESFKIKVKALEDLASSSGFLYAWLQPYGFTAWKDIYELNNAQSGKQVFSENWTISKNREELILSPLLNNPQEIYKIDSTDATEHLPIALSFQDINKLKAVSANQIIVDKDLLEFPLTLRHWEEGDVFYPFGMKGSKKLSDYFIDEKIPRNEKQKIWLLCSGSKIVWLLGLRADDRFKVGDYTKKLLKITWIP